MPPQAPVKWEKKCGPIIVKVADGRIWEPTIIRRDSINNNNNNNNNNNMFVKQTGRSLDRINLTQDRDQWRIS